MKIKDYMLDILVNNFHTVTSSIDEDGRSLDETGKYTVYNQCTGFYYAILYTYNHPRNPYYHKKEVLDLSVKCWDSFIETLVNADGSVKIITFDKYWCDAREEWCTLELINTLELLKNDLPEEKYQYYADASARLAECVKQSAVSLFESEKFRNAAKRHSVENHFLWSLACVYKYARIKGDIALQEQMKSMMLYALDQRMPFGIWLEAGTLIVNYAYVSYGALSAFTSYSDEKDEKMLEALKKMREYLENCTYDGLENMGCIDGRNRYSKRATAHIGGAELNAKRGEAFFTKHLTYIAQNPQTICDKHQGLGFFCLSFQCVKDGELKLEETEISKTIYVDQLEEVLPEYSKEKRNTIVLKEKGFTIPFCILTQKVFNSRWFFDRQSLISVYHKNSGLIIGGGHSMSDPSFSCFNVITDGTLSYLHSEGKFVSDKKAELVYNNTKCSIEITEVNESNVKLKYSAEGLKSTDRVLVHIPIPAMYTDAFSFHNTSYDTSTLCAFGNEVMAGEKVAVNGVEITLSQNAFLKYPVFAFNPYLQIQEPAKANAFILLTAELTYDKESVEIDISVK